jgi:RNA polymerase sigma factor (sigma-70 family)
VSPLHLRRYRAERLLRSEFEGLKGRVLGALRGRLAASRVTLADADLEACYAQAWQGLYTAILDGEQIANPAGWLVTVAFRRAIDEYRTRSQPGKAAADAHELSEIDMATGGEHDFAAALDDRVRLRQLLEGISGEMSERERQAVALCCLQGLSRAQAARQMGIGARRMERLMDGRGNGRPGVTAKLGALVETIAAGRFCEQQASLMRALAFGVLDPEGERHRLALAHQRSCPACRAYVLQLRGLAAALPPVFLPVLLRGLGSQATTIGRARVWHLHWRPRPGNGLPGPLAGSKLAVTGLVLAGTGVGVATLVSGGSHHHLRSHARPPITTEFSSAGAATPNTGARAGRRAASGRRHRRAAMTGIKHLDADSRRAATPSVPAKREFSFERAAAKRQVGAGSTARSTGQAGSVTSSTATGGGSQALREFGIE